MDDKKLKSFETYCAKHRLRITQPRLCALGIVHNATKPITAYNVLEAMKKDMHNPQPPTAYRALDFLTQHGFIHRIESLNAYTACDTDHNHKGSQFMICEKCGNAWEVHLCNLPKRLDDKTQAMNFTVNYWNAELHGVCAECQK